MTGYLAFIPAELMGVSAVLAAVTAGVYLGWHTPELTTPQVRLQGVAVWEIVQYMLNALLFVLVGLQLPIVVDALGEIPVATLVGYAALVSLTVIAVRFAWVFVVLFAPPAAKLRVESWRDAVFLSWSGHARGRLARRRARAPAPDRCGRRLSRPRPDPLPDLLGDPRHARRAGPHAPARDPGARARGRRPGRARERQGAHLRGGGGDRPARRARAGGVGAGGHRGAPARRVPVPRRPLPRALRRRRGRDRDALAGLPAAAPRAARGRAPAVLESGGRAGSRTTSGCASRATSISRISGSTASAEEPHGAGLAIRLRGVVKRYGAITCVDGLDLDAPYTLPGESKQARAELGVTGVQPLHHTVVLVRDPCSGWRGGKTFSASATSSSSGSCSGASRSAR